MWKAIERLKQGKSINVQDLETNLFWEFGKFTSLDGELLESYYSRFYTLMNELTRNQCKDNSPWIYKNAGYEGQRSGNVAGARDTVGSSMVQKFGIQCYNCKEYGHVARECQKRKRAKDAAYHREKMLLCKQEEARIQLNAEQADWKDDTDDESDDQELDAHYMYMAKFQQVSPDVVDSGPIFDTEPEQKANTSDMCMQSWDMSSYARTMIELRADAESKDTIVVAMPKLAGERNIGSGEANNLKKPIQAPRGVSVGPKVRFKPAKQVYRSVSKKPTLNTSGNKKKDVEPTK
nr:hypothetical protein [Tanacetum cinerariifolium]